MNKDLFSEKERERIQEAVSRAEGRTSGEIVPVIVPTSEQYEVAVWKGGALTASIALAALLLMFHFYEGWGLLWLKTGWGTAFVTLAAGIAGGLAGAFIRPLKRLLAGSDDMMRAVHRRAMKAFVEEEVFDTKDRTGILIFISLFEHRIEVLGDAGINQKVSPDDWADVVEHIRAGIRQGRLADGIIRAIDDCGGLLEKSGVEVRPDDTNELSDSIRIRKGH